MNFEAVITAILNKGDAESQLNELLKPRNIDITPNFDGGSGNLSSGSKRRIQQQAKASAKTYGTAFAKAQKSASANGYYITPKYKLDKSKVKKHISEFNKQDDVVSQIMQETSASQSNSRKAMNKAIRDIENDKKKAQQEARTAAKNASQISDNVENKSYRANYETQKSRLSNYYSGTNEYKNADKALKQYDDDLKELETRQTKFKADASSSNQQALIEQNEKVAQSYKTLSNEMKILNTTQSKALNPGEGSIQANKIRTYMENNTKAAKEYGNALENLAKQSENATTKGEAQSINQQFKQMQSEISAKGLTGNSMFSEVKRGFSQISQFVGTYGVLQAGMNKAQEMVQNTYDVDSAMTNLQMATGVSNDKAKELMKTYSDMGHQLKATGTDVAASSTEWMKQGQSVEKSNKLAESSIKLSKVGDLTSENATKYLTSARKGYGITSAEDTLKIVDKLSSVDMASATDVGGLAEGMSEVATNANLAGVSMDKLLGYLATIGETTQEGMSSVGTGLNAIFSRMGNIKLARLKDYQNNGEDLDIWGAVA
jgi:hypothetical protein